ncbi:flagellin [Rhizobium sp. CFBP 8762]|uniref:flagellin N-terminal helical domain-containing protein n=1 Tax=Rhizobium sp. CFBP 8762 TaxID=2775279 RepID=UPI00178100E1|nr:flagellin [Rhizobium sp. CFBP 8762]MBD8553457.1 flagellin [Rhizobium sp. CFBP 8762]
MTSILTNSSAMAALSTLKSINSDMETTQSRISSGKKVGTASDNAAYWSIATSMRSDNKALSTVEDALGLSAAKLETAVTGMEAAVDVVKTIKAKLQAATEGGVDKDKVMKEIKTLQDQLKSIVSSTSFNGVNLLQDANLGSTSTAAGSAPKGTQNLVGGFTRDASNNITVQTIDYALDKDSLLAGNTASTTQADKGILYEGKDAGTSPVTPAVKGIIDLVITSATTFAEMTAMTQHVNTQEEKLIKAAANLGAISARVTMQSEFVSKLGDSIDKGIGRLVDADMNEESTRLKALQTQQQLGIQALTIANSSSESILQLFR